MLTRIEHSGKFWARRITRAIRPPESQIPRPLVALLEAECRVMLGRLNKEQVFMNTVPFIMGRLPDPSMSPDRIQKRLKLFYGQLSARRLGKAFDEEAHDVPWDARNVIKRRAESLHECDVRTSIFAHLRDEQRRQLEVYRDGLKVVRIPSEHRADEIAAALHEAYPWMERATTTIWHALRRSLVRGSRCTTATVPA